MAVVMRPSSSPIAERASVRVSQLVRNTFLEFHDVSVGAIGESGPTCSVPRRRARSDSPRRRSRYGSRLMSPQSAPNITSSLTTVVVRNLPLRCNQSRFCTVLDSYGFEGTYDYVYVPFNTDRRKNKGYGVVNFITAEDGKRLHELWNHQKVFPAVFSIQPTKELSVGFAAIQGVENLRALQKKSDSMTFYRAVKPERTKTSAAGSMSTTGSYQQPQRGYESQGVYACE